MDSVAEYYKSLIPEYWFEPIDTPDGTLPYLEAKIKSIPKGKSFIFLADPHRGAEWENTNKMHSPAIIGYIRAVTGIEKVVLGGDYINFDKTSEIAVKNIRDYIDIMSKPCGDGMIVVPGNHDLNNPHPTEDYDVRTLSQRDLEKALMPYVKDAVFEDISERIAYLDCTEDERQELLAHSRLHYHIDDHNQKLRHIVINTGCPRIGNTVFKYFGVSVSPEMILQYDWLYETLLSVPEGYDVAIHAHRLIQNGLERLENYMLQMFKIVSAYRTRSKVTVKNLFSDNELVTGYYAAGTHEYDLTSAKGSGNVVILSADRHRDKQEMADYNDEGKFVSIPYNGEAVSPTGLVVNVTQTDAYRCFRPQNGVEMVPGTVTEQCFDIVTVCPDGGVKLTRIGSGFDRFIKASN